MTQTVNGRPGPLEPEEPDRIMERVVRDRRPGEIESGMMTGSDDAEISATERFECELSKQEALEALHGK